MNALATHKVAAAFVGFALVIGAAFAFATPAKADTVSDLQTQVNALLAQIAALSGSSTTGGSCTGFTFTRNHKMGETGGEVMQIQKFLNSMADTRVAATGAGSPGNETSYYGAATKAAVIKFQNKYAADILTPVGLTSGTGNWFASTRAKANMLNSSCGTTGGTTGGVTPTGTGLVVAAAAQPANSLAPQGVSRVPFTTFTLSNTSGAPVTVSGVTIERAGLASDSVFSGVVLLDSNGIQVGVSKTFNSNHQTVVGETMTIQPGQSQTFTVAGNMASSLASFAGQVVAISVIGVNTTSTVSGSLPITGAQHTINATLSVGTVSTSTSAFDPGAAQNRNIGDTGVRFAGIKFTAGSGEDIKFHSIRWRQVGSVSGSDLANVMTVVDGVEYPTVVSSDGKYFTTVFPGGILIKKGFTKDVYIKGDIVGSNSSSRTVDFDIDKVTDVYFVGQLYGYGIAPSGTYTPWFSGYVTTIQGASVTTIAKANEVAAQNIAVNVENQPLGGFVVDLKGEAISVQSMVFTVATSGTGAGLLTNVSIVDANGVVVAGPVDASGAGTTLTFTDTVTFPTGRNVYTIKGRAPSGWTNNGTVALSSTPSSGWTNITGQTTGNSITLTNGAFTMNTMTVRAAALAVNVSATPAAQNIVAGGQGVLFANYQFDASQSGEDIRFSTFKPKYNNGSFAGSPANLSSCQLFDGSTALNSGSNIVNPSTTASSTADLGTFTFDNPLVITKGTVKTVGLKCNVSSTAHAASTYQIGVDSTNIGLIGATGVTSSNSVTATGAGATGQTMTVASAGSVVVSTDASSPSYALASAGSSGVTLGVYKFRATNEDVNLNRVGLKLTNTASSSASDLVTVTLHKADGTQIGSATFTGSNANATSTLTSPLLLTRDVDVLITVKGTLASIGVSEAGTAGHLIAVDVDTNSTNTQGTGVQSGTQINASGSTAVAGVRMQKSFPTIAEETGSAALATSGIADGKLMRFRVTADSKGPVGISKFSLTIATTTATVTGVNIFAFTDSSYSTPVSGLSSDGRMLATDLAGAAWASSATQLEVTAQTSGAASTTIQIPAGATRYFEVRGSVSGATSGATVITTLLGDAAYPSLSGFMSTFLGVNADTNNDFIWSPNSTTTVETSGSDWTNGFGVTGLPSGGLTKTRSAN